MSDYSVKDVERVLRLSRSAVRGLINAGFVSPSRGTRRELRFSFQDLIVMRTARALVDAAIPRRRINRSLEELRRHLPPDVPLAGLTICAVGERVVVKEGPVQWQADDGQYLLGLDVSVDHGVLRVFERKSEPNATAADDQGESHFLAALELESSDPVSAIGHYRKAVEIDECNAAAWSNLGRLLHESGDLDQAERVYKSAAQACGAESLLMFNLGVLLDDAGKHDAAIEAYQASIEADPNMADAHYNLARLYECTGKPQHAIRHYGQYRRLMQS